MLSEKPWRLDAVILFFAAVFASLFLGMTVTELLRRAGVAGFQRLESPGGIVMGTFCFQGMICLLMLLFLRLHGVSWADALGLRGPRLKRALRLAALTVLVGLPLVWMLQNLSIQLLDHLGWKTDDQLAVSLLKKIRSGWLRIYLGIFTVVIAPVAEEFTFRGILYPVIKQLGFPRLALFGVSALFAAVHLDTAIFVPLFALALCLTWLYEETDNLMAPIAAHVLFNGINLVGLFFQPHTVPVPQ
jgi:membrane protease YdiL (CAAX protease family)